MPVSMTRRRIIQDGKTWALSRRSTHRHYLFNPDQARHIEQAYWYCLAVAANKYGILVHAACLMSTHEHEVVTDTRSELPRFLQLFHLLLARCTKAIRGWPAEVFDKDSTSAVDLRSPEAAIESLAYLIANPVEALAVRYARDWPGAQTLPQDIGARSIRVRRPDFYFRSGNPDYPDLVELQLHMPAMLQCEYGTELARERISERVRQRERQAWQEAKLTGRSFVGPRRILKLPHSKRASSSEEFGSMNPQFSAAGNREAAAEAVKELHRFNAQYNDALAAWTAGDRTGVFPDGTWWMRVFHGARCGPAP